MLRRMQFPSHNPSCYESPVERLRRCGRLRWPRFLRPAVRLPLLSLR
jgi:hypothetical protein